ncbi:malonyl-ACP O-methyltransferase BioC [Methylocucumis oryzae]|uniref:Malonyl-[acyl-carrier protein] O-methyltransferase n=1 Tax=Methylocucumis oryzae TaxID=1632867 RepID=A0A0F3II08_9GAMM|nr:malonyl-ACP O-methyltransferase BioC [Methylocucumis oryzae]KJV06302.1 hypothetical protein VZ94_12265 [Methylocucumis oryzae]
MIAATNTIKQQIKDSFALAAPRYEQAAQLQQASAIRLAGLIKPGLEQCSAQTVVELGCGTGFLTEALAPVMTTHRFIVTDFARPMLLTTQQKLSSLTTLHYACVDMDALPFTSNSVDLLCGNLALQWSQQLADSFNDFRRVLTRHGQIMFTTFGANSLIELKTAWASLDSYQHVNDFYSQEQLYTLLKQAGFSTITLQCQRHVCVYASVFELMQALKTIGANKIVGASKKGLTTRAQLQTLENAYLRLTQASTISATFEIITLQASV